MRTSLAAVVFGVMAGCGGHDPAPVSVLAAAGGEPTPDEPAGAAPPAGVAADPACAKAALRIEVTPPAAGDPTATFAFRWRGEGYAGAGDAICLVRGAEATIVPLDERREVTIRADAAELQRVLVWDRPHLVHVVPGATIVLSDNPCFGYELAGPDTDAWFVRPPKAYCARPGGTCRAGFTRPNPPRPVEDELCGATDPEIRRCVEDAEVALAATPDGAAARSPDDAFDPTPILALASAPLSLAPRTCGFPTIATGTEDAALVIGAGARWMLAVDGHGRLTGRVVRR
jgi:hypothetical protein